MQYMDYYQSPLGQMTLSSDGESLTGLWFDGQKYYGGILDQKNKDKKEEPSCHGQRLSIFEETKFWLDRYFAGKDPGPPPALSMKGTSFRQEVWEFLRQIPYGQVVTYGDLAKKLARKKGLDRMSAQAVGGAVGHNPIAILVPCHRVVGSQGSLTGYAGGIDKKVYLLQLEGHKIDRNGPDPKNDKIRNIEEKNEKGGGM